MGLVMLCIWNDSEEGGNGSIKHEEDGRHHL